MRPFRFGGQVRTDNPGQLRLEARAAEAAGSDVVCSLDDLGRHLSALEPLAFVQSGDLGHPIRLIPDRHSG